jgi:hypothetical protein
MTSLTVQDGKLVLRDGKLGTQEGCCCGGGGACCLCDSLTLYEDGFGNNFATEEEMIARVAQLTAEADAKVAIAVENGYECVGYEPITYVFNEENNAWETTGYQLQGRCCGGVSEEPLDGLPLGLWGACNQNASNRTCTPGLTEGECVAACGTWKPGAACDDCGICCGNNVSIQFGFGIFLSVLSCVEARRDIRAAIADDIESALTDNGWSCVTRDMTAIRDETVSFPNEPPTYEVECQGCLGHGEETLPISDCYALPDLDNINALCCGTIDYDNPVSYDMCYLPIGPGVKSMTP